MIKIIDFSGSRIPHSTMKFSGGETNIKIQDGEGKLLDSKTIAVVADINSGDDVMELLLVTDAIRRIAPKVEISLNLPYLPYARQDRVMTDGESFSLKVFANIVNSQNYTSVFVWDAHSDVGPALIDRCYNIPQSDLLGILGFGVDTSNTILVSPDAGAEKKIYKLANKLDISEIVFASKVRDVKNGRILETKINYAWLTDKDFLIADDICDGGGTFIPLAQELRKYTTGKIKLLVTHGIFSKGIQVFDGVIDEVIVLNNIGKAESTEKTKVTSAKVDN